MTELELHFPEFLSYRMSGWSLSKEECVQHVEAGVQLWPLLSRVCSCAGEVRDRRRGAKDLACVILSCLPVVFEAPVQDFL